MAGLQQSTDAKFARLEKIAAALLEAVEDERDYRIADSRWQNHLKHNTKLHTGEEVWRELRLPA